MCRISLSNATYSFWANTGSVEVGTSYDTPKFTVDRIPNWWKEVGQMQHPHVHELCPLADGGGSNGNRPRAWKCLPQYALATPFNLTVTVAYYPNGTSKWTPVKRPVR